MFFVFFFYKPGERHPPRKRKKTIVLSVANEPNKRKLRFNFCIKYQNQEKFAFRIGETSGCEESSRMGKNMILGKEKIAGMMELSR